MILNALLTLGLLLLAPHPLSAATAPVIAFTPAGQGREYEAITKGSVAETRPLGKLNLLLFAEGGPAKNYGQHAQGIAFNVRSHDKINVLARAVSHHVYSQDPMRSPLEPGEPATKSPRFARLAAGLQFMLPGTLNLETWAGTDAAGGQANSMEANLSWWPIVYTYYPLRISLGISQDDATHVKAQTLSGQLGFGKALGLTWFVTGAARLYNGGLLGKSEGRVSGGIGAGHSRGWGFKLAGGGGAHGSFADLAIFHAFRL